MQLGISGKARYRTIDEARIIDLLLVEGWAFDVRVGARAAAEQSARAVLDRIVGMGLPYQQSESGVRRFDPAEVYNFLVWVGRERREETWRERCIDTARRLVWEPHLGAHLGARSGACAGGEQRVAPSPNLLGPQRFSVTLRRTFNLTDRRPGDRVRLRLPLPLEDSALGDLQSRYLAPADMALPAAVGPARLDAMVEVPACGEVAMGINATFTARPLLTATSLLDLNRTEVELYTRPNEGLIKVSDKVGALATKASSGNYCFTRALWD